MERIKKILLNQWKITPLWVKGLAALGIIWSGVYFIDAGLILAGQAQLALAVQGFEAYVLVLKILIGSQFLLFIAHLFALLNQKVGPNLELRQRLNKIQAYLRRIHPLLGVTTLVMAMAHMVWNFTRFLSFDWPWSLQIITGLVGFGLIALVALSGDGALLAPANRRKKVILVHTIIACIFLVPFFFHI